MDVARRDEFFEGYLKGCEFCQNVFFGRRVRKRGYTAAELSNDTVLEAAVNHLCEDAILLGSRLA